MNPFCSSTRLEEKIMQSHYVIVSVSGAFTRDTELLETYHRVQQQPLMLAKMQDWCLLHRNRLKYLQKQ